MPMLTSLSASAPTARGLPASDWGGSCDAYVRVCYGGQVQRTRTVFSASRPVWGQALVLREDTSLGLLDK